MVPAYAGSIGPFERCSDSFGTMQADISRMSEQLKQSDGRREARDAVIKRAKIVFGRSIIDCIVMDVSPNGARVRTDAVVVIPEHVILRFSGGSDFVAQVQWALGMELGFAFNRHTPLADDHDASVALSAYNALSASDLEIPLGLLRTARFFDDPVLAKAAEEAEAAYASFKTALKDRIRVPT